MKKEKLKRAYIYSLLITGWGDIYLGWKKRGIILLTFSLVGAVLLATGCILLFRTLTGLSGPLIEGFERRIFIEGTLIIMGIIFIIVSGMVSLRNIRRRMQEGR